MVGEEIQEFASPGGSRMAVETLADSSVTEADIGERRSP